MTPLFDLRALQGGGDFMAHLRKTSAPSESTKNGGTQRRDFTYSTGFLKTRFSRAFQTILLLMIVAAVGPQKATLAQTDLGFISGTVRDAADAVVPNCQIEIKNSRTATTRTVTSDQNGY